MIKADIVIYINALELWLSDKTNIKDEIYNQIAKGDDYFLNQIRKGLRDEAKESGMSVSQIDQLIDKFAKDNTSTLMKYITFDKDKITFDYDKSADHSNLKIVTFRIPCTFDSSRYMNHARIT